jgi:hypothetical protein
MQTKFWVRRIILAAVWGLAVSTWASIAHYLGGIPDVGPILVVATMAFIILRPARRVSVTERLPGGADSKMHLGAPTA